MSNSNNTDTNTTTISAARLEANRRNAQLSTGPRTEAGKARSSQNARRDGWFARDLRVAEGQEELYVEFEAGLLAELQPQGFLELELFHDYLRAVWHKREVIAARNEAIAANPGNFLDDEFARKLDRLHRYERDFERRAARHRRELLALQSQRRQAEAIAAAEAAQTAQQNRTQPISLPEDLRRELHIMEVETAHWNAHWRAHKAGLLDLSPSQPAPPAPAQ